VTPRGGRSQLQLDTQLPAEHALVQQYPPPQDVPEHQEGSQSSSSLVDGGLEHEVTTAPPSRQAVTEQTHAPTNG
jgi:hypothetical protein